MKTKIRAWALLDKGKINPCDIFRIPPHNPDWYPQANSEKWVKVEISIVKPKRGGG